MRPAVRRKAAIIIGSLISLSIITVGASYLYNVIHGRFLGGPANKEWYLKPPAADATFHQKYCSEQSYIERCVRPDVIQFVILERGLLADPTQGREALMMSKIPRAWKSISDELKRIRPALQSAENDFQRKQVFRQIAEKIRLIDRAWNNGSQKSSWPPFAPVFSAIELRTYDSDYRLREWDGWKSDARRRFEREGVPTGDP